MPTTELVRMDSVQALRALLPAAPITDKDRQARFFAEWHAESAKDQELRDAASESGREAILAKHRIRAEAMFRERKEAAALRLQVKAESARGKGGHSRLPTEPVKIATIERLSRNPEMSQSMIAQIVGVSQTTVSRVQQHMKLSDSRVDRPRPGTLGVTARRVRVVEMQAQGFSAAEIGIELDIPRGTVYNDLRAVARESREKPDTEGHAYPGLAVQFARPEALNGRTYSWHSDPHGVPVLTVDRQTFRSMASVEAALPTMKVPALARAKAAPGAGDALMAGIVKMLEMVDPNQLGRGGVDSYVQATEQIRRIGIQE